MVNPSSGWDRVPVFGVWLRSDNTPSGGKVTLAANSRITRVDGRTIYPEGASVSLVIGDPTAQDSTVRSAVRGSWRANDATLLGAEFDGVAWDSWWDDVVVPAAIFTSFPATDDPDIVQHDWSVTVTESLISGRGKIYSITPLMTHLETAIPGINLGAIEVPPGSPTATAPMYAKGVAGGVAALDLDGDVVDSSGNKVVGGSGGSGGASTAAEITDATAVGRAVLTASSASVARAAIGAGTSNLTIGTVEGTAADAEATTTALNSKASQADLTSLSNTLGTYTTEVANKVGSSTVTELWVGTQAEFNALTPSGTTIYYIVG